MRDRLAWFCCYDDVNTTEMHDVGVSYVIDHDTDIVYSGFAEDENEFWSAVENFIADE